MTIGWLPGITTKPMMSPLSYAEHSCFCCLCICPDSFYDQMKCYSCISNCFKKNEQGFIDTLQSLKRRPLLVNSYFGIDKPIALPPNVTLTGPLVNGDADLSDDIAQKAPEISQFLNSAQESGHKVLLISLGTMLSWTQWSVDTIIEGVAVVNRNQKLKVLWSLPQDD